MTWHESIVDMAKCCELEFSCIVITQILKNNVLRDFIHVAGPYGVTHFVLLSRSDISANLVRMCALGLWQLVSNTLFHCVEDLSSTTRTDHHISYTISKWIIIRWQSTIHGSISPLFYAAKKQCGAEEKSVFQNIF